MEAVIAGSADGEVEGREVAAERVDGEVADAFGGCQRADGDGEATSTSVVSGKGCRSWRTRTRAAA